VADPASTVDAFSQDLVHRVDLERNPVGHGQLLAHVFAPEEGSVRDDGRPEAQTTDLLELAAEVPVERRLAVRDEGDVVDSLSGLEGQPRLVPDLLAELGRCVPCLPVDELASPVAKLAVDAGIGAALGRDVVDAEPAAEAT